jgi:hypothetical protein
MAAVGKRQQAGAVLAFAWLVAVLASRFACVYVTDGHAAVVQPTIKKSWDFPSKPGTVKVNLLADAKYPGIYSLEILYQDGAEPSVKDEAHFLREVLQQFETIGVDQRQLTSISMLGFAEPDVRERIGTAALHSRAWQSSARRGLAEQVVKDLLTATGAYAPINASLREYELEAKVGSVEKVAAEKCSKVPISDAACRAHPNARVPVGANLTLVITKMNSEGAK